MRRSLREKIFAAIVVSYVAAAPLFSVVGAADAVAQDASHSDVFVVSIGWSCFQQPAAVDNDYRQCSTLLQNCARCNLQWIARTFKEDPSGRLYVLTRMNEHGIRPATSLVYALATILKTRAFDEATVGISRQEALERTLKLLRGAAITHKVNADPEMAWGDSWQSALWAAQLGFGGWMLWENLDTQTRQMLSDLAVHEADRFLDGEVPYWNGKGGAQKRKRTHGIR